MKTSLPPSCVSCSAVPRHASHATAFFSLTRRQVPNAGPLAAPPADGRAKPPAPPPSLVETPEAEDVRDISSGTMAEAEDVRDTGFEDGFRSSAEGGRAAVAEAAGLGELSGGKPAALRWASVAAGGLLL